MDFTINSHTIDNWLNISIQVLKLQEAPESIPQGEMPRHLTVYCERILCERVAPGARVIVLGIYSIKKIAKTGVSSLHAFLFSSNACHNIKLRSNYVCNFWNEYVKKNLCGTISS